MNLAIKGHPTRGSEVIEILEMLGGINERFKLVGLNENFIYYICPECNNNIHSAIIPTNQIVFTLEEFLEKFPYKIGDKAFAFGYKCTIIDAVWDGGIYEVIYTIKLDTSKYTTTKLSKQLQPYKEETMKDKNNNWARWELPDGYEFQDKEGNVINTDTIKLVKKQPQYPKTYEECCEVLDFDPDRQTVTGYDAELIENFQTLKLCRDAYWKIAGEQIGLDEPWEPNWKDDSDKYFICYLHDELWMSNIRDCNRLLVFPTKEMRDAFYNNFKKLIETCKEL